MIVTRFARRWISALALFLAALPIFAIMGCGKKEEPASTAPPHIQYTTPEGNMKAAMPGGGPPQQGKQGQ
jgi:hypothetical protein